VLGHGYLQSTSSKSLLSYDDSDLNLRQELRKLGGEDHAPLEQLVVEHFVSQELELELLEC
jgi:hypothetical protein